MALCESQLESGLTQLKRESPPSSESGVKDSPEKRHKLERNGDLYGLDQVPGGLPLSVDYRSPVSHFVPPELYAARHKQEQVSTPESSGTPTPMKRKRGRPRIDKTSPEYLANLAARKQAREMAAMMNSSQASSDSGEKRKRGRPRVDKTSPEYLARKRARELEALERKAKREYKRRNTGDSMASSSAVDGTPRVKRKYTKRTPSTKKNDGSPTTDRVKGKRGRPKKTDQLAANKQSQQGKIRVRSNLMPENSEPITLDSDDEPDLGSPSQASDSLSLDENLRALRHIHEKYANIDKDELYESHLLAVNFKKPPLDQSLRKDDDDVLSVRSSEGGRSVQELETRVEKLEDSSNSGSSSSSESGSSSSGSSSSSSSNSSSSSDSSDSESGSEDEKTKTEPQVNNTGDDERSFGAWSYSGAASGSGSDSEPDPERGAPPPPPLARDDVSESDNESPDKSFQCHICKKWYSTRVTLKIHRRSHQNRGGGTSRSRPRSSDRYECDCCNETFNRREKLWDHKAEAHRGAMTVRCAVCRRCFEDDGELARHEREHSGDERAGRCGECGATFARFDQLRRHRACAHAASRHHSPATATATASPPSGARLSHACAQCGKRFGHAHSLTRHLHNHAKQLFRCVVCKASFAEAEQLAEHLNSHLANYKRLKP